MMVKRGLMPNLTAHISLFCSSFNLPQASCTFTSTLALEALPKGWKHPMNMHSTKERVIWTEFGRGERIMSSQERRSVSYFSDSQLKWLLLYWPWPDAKLVWLEYWIKDLNKRQCLFFHQVIQNPICLFYNNADHKRVCLFQLSV